MTENAADESDIQHPLNQKAESTNHQLKHAMEKSLLIKKLQENFLAKFEIAFIPHALQRRSNKAM